MTPPVLVMVAALVIGTAVFVICAPALGPFALIAAVIAVVAVALGFLAGGIWILEFLTGSWVGTVALGGAVYGLWKWL